MSCSTRVVIHGVDSSFAYGAFTRYGRPFQAVLLPRRFVTPPRSTALDDDSHNPTCSNACQLYAYMGLGCFPFARHY